MPKFTCQIDDCGFEAEFTHLDGYGIGDRLLEGVIFKVTIDENGEYQVKVLPEHAEYFSDLNEQKWIAALIKECKDHEGESINFDPKLGSVFQCPKCRYSSVSLEK